MCKYGWAVSPPGLSTQIEAFRGIFSDPSAKKTPISMRYRPGVKRSYLSMYRCGWAGKKTAMSLKEMKSNEEQLQARKQYTCTPPDPLSPAIFIYITETTMRLSEHAMYANMRITNPQSYCGEETFDVIRRERLIPSWRHSKESIH